MKREWVRALALLVICEVGIHLNEIGEHLPRYAFHLLFWAGGLALWVLWVKVCGGVEGDADEDVKVEAAEEGEGEA